PPAPEAAVARAPRAASGSALNNANHRPKRAYQMTAGLSLRRGVGPVGRRIHKLMRVRVSPWVIPKAQRARELYVMQPTPPFWFGQRQGKMEAAGPEQYRLTAPNLPEAYIGVRRGEDDHWRGFLREKADGPDPTVGPRDYEDVQDAWGAAFELYRTRYVV